MPQKTGLPKLLTKGKCLFLAYDQGLEHGPTDFNDRNVNPLTIINLAKHGKFNALVFQKGIAEKYNREIKKSKVNLILKLNGKTNLVKGEPLSTQMCTVKEALKLGAAAVGYTIYIGSTYENKMFREFEKIEREAHSKNMPVIAWIYPRGKAVENKPDSELLAYATRVGLEIGADIVKIHWSGNNVKDLSWAVKAAGRCRVVIAGGLKKNEKELLKNIKQAMSAGVAGIAIGRNVWQHPKPLEITKKIQRVLWL